jgi:hypothetical protein
VDVQEMILRRLVDPSAALCYFEQIEPRLYLFPAINSPSFRRAVERTFRSDTK